MLNYLEGLHGNGFGDMTDIHQIDIIMNFNCENHII